MASRPEQGAHSQAEPAAAPNFRHLTLSWELTLRGRSWSNSKSSIWVMQ